MYCEEIDYRIYGNDMQVVEVELDPGETVIAEAGAGFFGGEGFILQRLRGDGMAFVHVGGTVIRKELQDELLRVDSDCLVAFTSGINYNIEQPGNLKSMFFGGEGLFLATLQGTGVVYLQSLPFSRLADRILGNAPSEGGRNQGESFILGGIGKLIGGR